MSYKYNTEKTGTNQYFLPKTGKMNCGVNAFFSEALFDASEESIWQQAVNSASYDGVIRAYIMPDGHSGFGVPIGSVIVTDRTLIQAGSGFDISCGMLAIRTNLYVDKIVSKEKRKEWINAVEQRVATGLGSNKPKLMKSFNSDRMKEILKFGAKALGAEADSFERQYIPVNIDIDFEMIPGAFDKAMQQLGSLGSGNHFIEMQVDTYGYVWVMIHTGSRGYGYKTAEYFFYKGAEHRGLPKNRREESFLYIDEDLGREYWAYHNSAANFAIANRYVIAKNVIEVLNEMFDVNGEIYYDISHNLIQEEHILNDSGIGFTKGFVHRKGATRAFPVGFPGLSNTPWLLTGHPIIVPGSMYDGAAIMLPEYRAYTSGYSVNHGSGRVLARGEAKRKFSNSQDQLNTEMSNVKRVFDGVVVEGIISNQTDIPADESKHVYKDLDVVLQVLREENIASLHRRLYPVANIKGDD